MHITMIKKRLVDGSECPKCAQATAQLEARGLLGRIDAIVWAFEDDATSPGMQLAAQHGVDSAPFFLVRDRTAMEGPVRVYTSVLQLIREHMGEAVTQREEAHHIDVDDIGGI